MVRETISGDGRAGRDDRDGTLPALGTVGVRVPTPALGTGTDAAGGRAAGERIEVDVDADAHDSAGTVGHRPGPRRPTTVIVECDSRHCRTIQVSRPRP
jgi:hypothetical protein